MKQIFRVPNHADFDFFQRQDRRMLPLFCNFLLEVWIKHVMTEEKNHLCMHRIHKNINYPEDDDFVFFKRFMFFFC